MSEEQKEEAADLAKKASRQAKNAAKNGIRVVQNGTDAAVSLTAEEAEEIRDKAEEAIEDAVNTAKRRFAGKIAPDVGMLALELTLSLYMSGRAYLRYRKIQGYKKGYTQGLKHWAETVPVEVVD